MDNFANSMNRRDNEFKKYQAYFCHANADTDWVMNRINVLESDKYQFKCAEYERDFIGGKYIFDLFHQFMEDSHFIVIVLSPSFLKSKWTMYQLYLAVQYSLDNNEGNIVPLVYKTCDVPMWMKVFDPVDATKKGWQKIFTERLCRPARRFPKNSILSGDGRISIDALRTCTTRKVNSEPILAKDSNTLSEHNFSKVKTLSFKRKGKANFLEETKDGEDIQMVKAVQSSGEVVQAKRESETKDRVSADDILHIQEHITPSVLSMGEHTKETRSRNSNERVDAETILEIDEKIDSSSIAVGGKTMSTRYQRLSQEHFRDMSDACNTAKRSEIPDNTLQKGERGKKRKNADILQPANVQEVSSLDSVTGAQEVRSHLQDAEHSSRFPNENRSSGNIRQSDNGSMLGSQSGNRFMDMFPHDFTASGCIPENQESHEILSAELETFKQSLPSKVSWLLGDGAKDVRRRRGIRKTRIDADSLLFKAS